MDLRIVRGTVLLAVGRRGAGGDPKRNAVCVPRARTLRSNRFPAFQTDTGESSVRAPLLLRLLVFLCAYRPCVRPFAMRCRLANPSEFLNSINWQEQRSEPAKSPGPTGRLSISIARRG